MTRAVPAALLLLLALHPRVSVGASDVPPPHPLSVDDYLNQPIADIVVEGPPWTADLKRNLPLRAGLWLTRDRLHRALLHFHQNREQPLSEVRVVAEPAEVGKRKGIRLIFRIEAVQKIHHVSFTHSGPLDNGTLLRAANLPVGTELWPDLMDKAAAQVAREFEQAGWREAVVNWTATPTSEGVSVVFDVRRGERTTLVRLEFIGNRGFNDAALSSAFDITPGSRLTMEAFEEGIVELKERYRAQGFYRAAVGLPIVKAADNRAVVTIPIDSGPKFAIQFRGNRIFDDEALLARLHYTGEEVLDDSTRQDLAGRLKQFYELAGYPDARVTVSELPVPRAAPAPPSPPPAEPRSLAAPPVMGNGLQAPPTILPVQRYLMFTIREGREVRIVERRFEGDFLIVDKVIVPNKGEQDVARIAQRSSEAPQNIQRVEADFQRRTDFALEEAVPKDLVNSLDDALMRAANLGGGPGAAAVSHPRVQPHEVFSNLGYSNACDEIASLYHYFGFLEARVGPATPERIAGIRSRVVIPIVAGPRFVVSAVKVEGVKEMEELKVLQNVSIHVGDALSYAKIEDTRGKILQLYQSAGYLSATVDDSELPKPSDQTQVTVQFQIVEGSQVRASSIDIKGANHTSQALINNALTIRKGDLITPQERQKSVQNLLTLGTFTSASVRTDKDKVIGADTPLLVVVEERPGYSLDLNGGLSLVDGPRLGAQFLAAHFLGSTTTFTATAKLNVPIFRICSFHVRSCTVAEEAAQTTPDDPVEWRASVGLVLPVFGRKDESPLDQRVDVIAQNMLRPAFYLQKYSVLGTLNGLPHGKLNGLDLNTLFQLEVEQDTFTPQNAAASSLADQKALLLPKGRTQVVSLRPTLTLDGRGPLDDKGRRPLNPNSGGQVSLSLDFAHDINIAALGLAGGKPTPVSLISGMVTGGGYIPIYPARRLVLALSGRLGRIFSQYDQVIGTKVFFLGGTNTLRGFSEDGLVPQDVRETIHTNLQRCGQVISGIGCTATATSQGGTMVFAGRSDLRFALTESIDGDLFFDAGNLWSDPRSFNPIRLRYSAGVGVAYNLPIGPAAIDLAFNLAPDVNVGESLAQVHFAIGL